MQANEQVFRLLGEIRDLQKAHYEAYAEQVARYAPEQPPSDAGETPVCAFCGKGPPENKALIVSSSGNAHICKACASAIVDTFEQSESSSWPMKAEQGVVLAYVFLLPIGAAYLWKHVDEGEPLYAVMLSTLLAGIGLPLIVEFFRKRRARAKNHG